MRRIVFALIFIVAACGGSSADSSVVTAPPPPAPVPPTSVVIASASTAPDAFSDAQIVSLHLHNNGGSGDYYLEFWALPNSPNGPRRTVQSNPVNVLAGYDEAVAYKVPFASESVKVKSRPVNTAVYTQTDCKVVGTQPDYCP